MDFNKVVSAIKSLAPTSLAEKWDNTGLLVEPSSSSSISIERVFLTVDLTEAVLEEALVKKAQFIIAYHPPIFTPFKQLTSANAKQRIIVKAIENRIAIYSPHTSFDSVSGGINDWIATGLSALSPDATVDILQPHESLPPGETHKVVVFIPEDHADKLREELSSVGAGVIGNYSQCSFNIEGTGTFFGNDNTNPAVGSKGKLERAKEIRLEMVCAKSKLPLVAQVIHKVHPYETPAWEVYALHAQPSSNNGQGRLVKLGGDGVQLISLIAKVKELFGLQHVRVAVPDGKKHESITIKSVALCAGAGGTVIAGVRADVYLTGEMRHHEVLEATSNGTTVILCEHTNTERGYLKVFKEKLHSALEGKVAIHVSEVDADPLVIV